MAHVELRSPRFHTVGDVLERVKSRPFLWVTHGTGNDVFSPSPVNSMHPGGFISLRILKNNQRLQSNFI